MAGPTRSDDFYDVDRSTFWGGLTGSLIDAEQGIFDWQDENLRKKDGFQNTTDQYLEQERQAELESGSYREQQNPLLWSGSEGYPKFGEGTPPSLMLDVPQASEEDVKQGGVLNPDPLENPAGAISAMSTNRGAGKGNAVGFQRPPEAPPMKEQSQRIQQEQSKQVLFDQTKLNNWYESPSFYNGMLSMGLSLMAGADIATAFNAGAQTFERNFGIEKRKTWANDLREAGYDDLEIEKYIETGDNKVLTDPMERQRQARRDALAEAQLRQQEYETSPEMQQYKQQRQAWDDQFRITQAQNQQALQQAQFNLQQAQFAETQRQNDIMNQFRQEQAQAKAAGATAKYNEGLSKAQNQYTRGRQGLKNYQETEARIAPNYDERGTMGKMLDSQIIDMVFDGKETSTQLARMMNNEATEMITAEREFLAPLLRKDSGAAISASEWRTTGEIYFPRPGDSPERRAQKQQAREVAVLAMDPKASPQIQQVLELYTTGQIPALRVKGSKVFAFDGKGWFEVQQ